MADQPLSNTGGAMPPAVLSQRRIAVVGHSMGGPTAGLLLGAQLTDEDGTRVSLVEPCMTAGIAAPGSSGADASEYGEAEVLQLVDLARPRLGAGQVHQLQVAAAGVNYADIWQSIPTPLPLPQ